MTVASHPFMTGPRRTPKTYLDDTRGTWVTDSYCTLEALIQEVSEVGLVKLKSINESCDHVWVLGSHSGPSSVASVNTL